MLPEQLGDFSYDFDCIVYEIGLSYDMILANFILIEYGLRPMELRHLRYFIAVAEEGHITRAAERLGIQQPPLSRQIRELECELGVQLFYRIARGVELTDAGRTFLDGARATLVSLELSSEMARRTGRGEQGGIFLGYPGTAAFHPLVPRIIREFQVAFPLVSVKTIAEGFPDDLVERMRNNQIDVAFLRTPVTIPEGIVVEPLQEDTMVVALPSGHALASGGSSLPLKALAGETFIAYGRGPGMLTMQSNVVIAACQAAGFNPCIGHVAPDNLSRINLVAAGLGIAIVSSSTQRMNVEGVVYRPLKSASPLRVPLNLLSRRGDPSAVVRQFRVSAKRTARNWGVGKGKVR
jgi:DNA-binding transcriptional LysR family regulator